MRHIFRVAFDTDRPDTATEGNGKKACVSGSRDSWQKARFVQDVPVEGFAGFKPLVARHRQRGAQGENMVGAKAGIDALDAPQSACQQTKSDQQHQRTGHFSNHQCRAEIFAPATHFGAAGFVDVGGFTARRS